MKVWTDDHEAALQEWVAYLGCPNVAVDAVRRKFQRIGVSPADIRTDLQAFQEAGVTDYRLIVQE